MEVNGPSGSEEGLEGWGEGSREQVAFVTLADEVASQVRTPLKAGGLDASRLKCEREAVVVAEDELATELLIPLHNREFGSDGLVVPSGGYRQSIVRALHFER